jgi:hypothetical protein
LFEDFKARSLNKICEVLNEEFELFCVFNKFLNFQKIQQENFFYITTYKSSKTLSDMNHFPTASYKIQ